MRSSGLALTAAAVLALEGVALTVIAVIELFGLGAGDAAILPTAIALIVLTLVGAAALFTFAVGTRRDQTWARSGAVVLQILAVVLALNSLTVQPVPWGFVIAVGAPGVIGFVLLIASARRASVTSTAEEPSGSDGAEGEPEPR